MKDKSHCFISQIKQLLVKFSLPLSRLSGGVTLQN